jgi:hypothetical protein
LKSFDFVHGLCEIILEFETCLKDAVAHGSFDLPKKQNRFFKVSECFFDIHVAHIIFAAPKPKRIDTTKPEIFWNENAFIARKTKPSPERHTGHLLTPATAFSIEGEKFVFVAIDELGQGCLECVGEAGASKPVFWMSNDPFRQRVSQQVALPDRTSLVIQPTNLVG